MEAKDRAVKKQIEDFVRFAIYMAGIIGFLGGFGVGLLIGAHI